MNSAEEDVLVWVNRHTGGLESTAQPYSRRSTVNRHTGGLEIEPASATFSRMVNRHTGGLENIKQ